MPTVSPDGRTYTFRIRRGFRFSPPSNEAVTAETFRHTIERQIATSPKDPGLDRYVADIVGAKAFYAGRTAHVAGLSVRGNRLLITLVKPAGDLPTRVAMPEFCPVPLSVPVRRWSRPADPLGRPLLHRLEPGPPERPPAEPELPRPAPATLLAHRRAGERARGEGHFPGRPRQGRHDCDLGRR
jgi:ABC-type oligopeptide transport system, periplasmic component